MDLVAYNHMRVNPFNFPQQYLAVVNLRYYPQCLRVTTWNSISRCKNLGILCRKQTSVAIFHTFQSFLYCIQCWPINQLNVLRYKNFALGNNWTLQRAKTRCRGVHNALYMNIGFSPVVRNKNTILCWSTHFGLLCESLSWCIAINT